MTRWKSQRRMEQDELANRATRLGLSVYNAALLGLVMLNIIMIGSIASFETTGIRFAASYFGLQPIVAGTIVSLNGVVGVCSLLNIGVMGRFLTDTQMIIGGITVFAVGTVSFAALQSVEMGAENSIVHYIVAIFMIYGFGYPIAQSAVNGLFSKGKFGVLLIFILFTLNQRHVCCIQLSGGDRRDIGKDGLRQLDRLPEFCSRSRQGILPIMVTLQ